MIPKAHITAWRSAAPWPLDAHVEQDLVISRALVEIFRNAELSEALAFRGGTALYKLHLLPPARYSEDIDLVQVKPMPVGTTLDLLRSALDPWLGTPRRELKEGRANLVYRFSSEDSPPLPMRLKIEINTREHFTQFGYLRFPFAMRNPWFNGQVEISTYSLDEMLGTKLRALFQRRKGRDLFDLWMALESGKVDVRNAVSSFLRYMREEGHAVSRAQFEANLAVKRNHPDFRDDMGPLLRPGTAWDVDRAMDAVLAGFVSLVPGEPWKGTNDRGG